MLRSITPSALLAAVLVALPAQAETIDVVLDQARIVKIDRAASTVIIGNPAIVDVTVHDAQTLVLTGRSFGQTNLVVLDGTGEPILDDQVAVASSEVGSLRIYRQAARTTYSCNPACEPTVTVGDTDGSFSGAASQIATRESMATTQR